MAEFIREIKLICCFKSSKQGRGLLAGPKRRSGVVDKTQGSRVGDPSGRVVGCDVVFSFNSYIWDGI
jgi:hypothetical protein